MHFKNQLNVFENESTNSWMREQLTINPDPNVGFVKILLEYGLKSVTQFCLEYMKKFLDDKWAGFDILCKMNHL